MPLERVLVLGRVHRLDGLVCIDGLVLLVRGRRARGVGDDGLVLLVCRFRAPGQVQECGLLGVAEEDEVFFSLGRYVVVSSAVILLECASCAERESCVRSRGFEFLLLARRALHFCVYVRV